jgi:hypothetical protein
VLIVLAGAPRPPSVTSIDGCPLPVDRDLALVRAGVTDHVGDRLLDGRAHHALARPGQARHHWAEALALYTHLGTPQADQIRAQLADPGTRNQEPARTIDL